jgi:putative hemin transport protein
MTLANNTTVDARTARIREAFNINRSKMTMVLARELGVPEVDVIRALPDGLSVELDIARWEQLLRAFEALEQVHVISSNSSVTLECFGQFGNFSTWGEFFNVQTKSLDMHIRFKELSTVFAVQKPGHMDGVNTLSFQFFDSRGNSAFKVFLTFGGTAPTAERIAQFTDIRDRFRLAEGGVG